VLNPRYERLRDAFKEAYELVRPWPEATRGELHGAMLARECELTSLIACAHPLTGDALQAWAGRAQQRLDRLLATDE
jgi:hypothetical protein